VKQAASGNGIPTTKRVSGHNAPKPVKIAHHRAICSVLDPFCIHARTAQRPDGGPPTIPYQVRTFASIYADTTTGTCKFVFTPNPQFCQLNHSTSVANWASNSVLSDVGGGGFITTNAKEIRLTSFGIVLRSAMTATTAKGLVILTVESQPVYSATFPKGSMYGTESSCTTLAAGTEITWVSKPQPSAHLFRPVAAFTSSMTDFDWLSLSVEIVGGDVTNNIQYMTAEIVMNIELTVANNPVVAGNTGSNLAMLTKTPPVPNRVALAAAEHAHVNRNSIVQGGIDKATSYLSKVAGESLDSILSEGMALFASLV
jgi:hypothetical protein